MQTRHTYVQKIKRTNREIRELRSAFILSPLSLLLPIPSSLLPPFFLSPHLFLSSPSLSSIALSPSLLSPLFLSPSLPPPLFLSPQDCRSAIPITVVTFEPSSVRSRDCHSCNCRCWSLETSSRGERTGERIKERGKRSEGREKRRGERREREEGVRRDERGERRRAGEAPPTLAQRSLVASWTPTLKLELFCGAPGKNGKNYQGVKDASPVASLFTTAWVSEAIVFFCSMSFFQFRTPS